ncbi:MAG: CRISPR-associated endonuclease Cas2 [Bacillota bacterium]|jgi:CRISPR-associated protein Cas2|nr:CRISPR-associated endonuclease Cas2 [Bacillota bacterium]
MFAVVVYDINQSRVAKVLKHCRKYLYWVQNSVFEGEITPAQLRMMVDGLRKIIDEEEDSVIIYTFRTRKYSSVEILGVRKGGEDTIL